MMMYVYAFDAEYRYCLLATGTDSLGEGPERTVARIDFKGSDEERKADFLFIREAIENFASS